MLTEKWADLLNGNRRKSKHEPDRESLGTAAGRMEMERDFDRILFSTPTRRLADKTQVFPLDKNDSVRTRLTHSYEVSNLARSIGMRLAFEMPEKIFGKDHDELNVKRSVPALLAAIGLAHDLGNPPFGHQGEKAIQDWFKSHNNEVFGQESSEDFTNFDGNAQTFRLLTKLQILNDNYGLNLTYGTLAATLKYPTTWKNIERSKFKKAGVFESERSIAEDVWQETGLKENQRHPLTYIMEACDDIAYSILDAEDTIKKGYASFYDLVDYLEHAGADDEITKKVLKKAREKNTEFKKENLSPRELNDISMQMMRVCSISALINPVVDEFSNSIESILDGGYKDDLIKNSEANSFCKALKRFDLELGYKNKSVLELELRGSNYIKSLMTMLWEGIRYHESKDAFSEYAFQRISENYRRVFKEAIRENRQARCQIQAQLLADAISGMTDSYLISLHDELKPLYDGSRKIEG